MKKNEKIPRWYVVRTLLGCEPGSDINRRIICHDGREVVTFNFRMDKWHPDDDRSLNTLMNYLNKTREHADEK